MSFSHSSNNISVDSSGYLTASCRRIDGSWNDSSINLNNYIGNIDGHLTWGESNFAQTSQNISVSGGTLYASCQRMDGSWNDSSLNLDNYVTNNDGNLQQA
jgi:hypothetical protein